MDPKDVANYLAKINNMTHFEMCHLYRFAKPGSVYFIRDTTIEAAFMERFNAFGGMTPEMSKRIGL